MKNSYKIILSYIASSVLLVVLVPYITQIPYGFMDDDSFIYAQVSYNDATIGKSTFDGKFLTDGYHQLWAFLLTSTSRIVALVTLNKDVHITAYVLLYWSILFYFLIRHGKGWEQKIILLSLAVISAFVMETLMLSVLILEIYLLMDKFEQTNKLPWYFYPIIALVPLTRIDSSIVVLALLFCFLINKQWKIFLVSVLSFITGVAVHFCMVYSVAGFFYSVSSKIKKTNADLFGNSHIWRNLTEDIGTTYRSLVFLILFSTMVYLFVKYKPRFLKSYIFYIGLSAGLFTLIHMHANYLRNWYLLPGVLVPIVVILRFKIANKMFFHSKRALLHVILVMVIAYIPYRIYQCIMYSNEAGRVLEFIQYVDENVPKDKQIFQIDGSGYLGWKLGRIVNGDGLYNSHQYAELLLSGKLSHYLKDHNIAYCINNVDELDDYIIHISGLEVPRSSGKLLKSIARKDSHYFCQFRLYKIDHSYLNSKN